MKPLVAEGLVWLDGKLVPRDEACVGLTDPAVQAGLGVFETLAVRGGLPVDLGAHLERLQNAAARLWIQLPDRDVLESALRETAGRVEGGFGWMKVSAVRGGACAVWGGRMEPGDEGKPQTAILLPWRRNPNEPTAGIKTLNYANTTLGIEEARRNGVDEGIWLNTKGHLAEGCLSNVFVVRHRALYTPSQADGILPGITRGIVLRVAAELGLPVHEGKIRLKRLLEADEVFLTSSLRGVRPLVALDGRPLGRGAVPGPLTRVIATRVAALRGVPVAPRQLS